jgi:hypothetical protein
MIDEVLVQCDMRVKVTDMTYFPRNNENGDAFLSMTVCAIDSDGEYIGLPCAALMMCSIITSPITTNRTVLRIAEYTLSPIGPTIRIKKHGMDKE